MMGSSLEGNCASASADDWRKALEKVIPAVVVLRITACRAFDTDLEGDIQATGFVVDKKRGIILTNRHVVKPGPIVAEAMFVNKEEIPVFPFYRDPVHDFGFFRYDPGAVRFLSYEEIPLAPEVAYVGQEIRVVGNDSCQKVSIQAGTIARLDRDSPRYSEDGDGYNDFNTFYMQAASGTKGGSSGSPVVDYQGRAVAMNAGGLDTESATSLFLPLERVVRALHFIQMSKDSSGCGWEAVYIPRGTLQATFLHKSFNETRKLGLKSESEQMVRHASPAGETGMLVVDSLVPGGPAHKQLKPGDILVQVNGEVITQFLKLETLLDNSVDQKIDLSIQRGGISITVNLLVQDLHSITPNSFLEVSGAVIQSLSYQQARNFRFKCGVVHVAKPGYMLSRADVPRHAIITKFAGKEISQLDDLIVALSELTRGDQVPLEYISYLDRNHSKSVVVTIDLHEWHGPPLIYTRDDGTGLWTTRLALPHASAFLSLGESNDGTKKQHLEDDTCSKDIVLSDCAIHEPSEERLADISDLNNTRKLGDREGITANASVAERVLEPTLVIYEVHVPPACHVDGVYPEDFSGTGVIVYHSRRMGLVVVDRSAVGVSCCDVMLSFAASDVKIPGEVVFLHPVHNFAFVAYDPSSLGVAGASAVRCAKLLPEPALQRGDSVFLVSLTESLQAKSRKSVVVNPCAALEGNSYKDWPAYMAINMDVIELDNHFGRSFSGVLSDERGFVRAIWGKFSQMKFDVRGIPIYAISEILDKITRGEMGKPRLINGITRRMPLLRILDAELYGILRSKAKSFGLKDSWIQALVEKNPLRRQVLCVKGCLAGSEAEKKLETNDMLLAINKEPITCFRDIEKACQGLDVSEESDSTLSMTILRKGKEIEVLVGTDIKDGNGTTRVVNWCGCIVQEPHPAVRALGFVSEVGKCVYVSGRLDGSLATRYGLEIPSWIVEVNDKLTPDLDSFVEVIKGLEHGDFVRVRTATLHDNPEVHILRQDLHYWPTWELKFDMETATWRREMIKALDASVH